MEKRGITATPEAILDFSHTGKTGHHFGQQAWNCRLRDSFQILGGIQAYGRHFLWILKNYGFKQQTVDIHLSTPIILKKDCMKMYDQYRSSTRILITDNVHTYLPLEFYGCKFEIVEVVISHLVFIGSLCKRFYGAICSRVEVAWRPGKKISLFAPPETNN